MDVDVDIEIWTSTRKHGAMENGAMGTRHHGDTEAWKHGNT
jgi:hypothetical protein